MQKPTITLIIPTCNEKFEGYLAKMAHHYPKNVALEYLIVDSGTNPNVFTSLERSDFRLISLDNSNRAERLSKGIEEAQGELVVFHHPRSLLELSSFNYLLKSHAQLTWGGFTHRFDRKYWGLRFTSWYSNQIRPRLGKIVYLDHCLYFKKNLLDQPIPSCSIFEDTEISKILRRHGPPRILPFISTTSSIRFETHGFFKQFMMNQILKVKYHLGHSDQEMNARYEKDLNLNQ